MNLTLDIKDSLIIIKLKEMGKVFDQQDLTISRNLDTLLIGAIDKIISRNRIDRLSLKSLKIPAKLKDEAVSNMILKTIKAGLKV